MRALPLPLAAALLVAGCGASAQGRPQATLLLDFTPNAVHAGIYEATAHHYDDAAGVHLSVEVPGASTDALRLLQSGRADLALLDIHDLGLARERGADIVGVMALVQRPLAAVMAAPGVGRPRALEGRRVGVTGLPSDTAVLDSVVRGDGGDPRRVRATTIGFDAVKALLAGRVAGATAFWDVEGVELRARRPGFREFRVDQYGAPRYPELVLCTTRRTLERNGTMVRAAVRALQRGYARAIAHRAEAVSAMTHSVSGLDPASLTAQLRALGPAFTSGARYYGQLRPAVLRAWAAWDVRFGILKRPPDLARAFDLGAAAPSAKGGH
jgi:ABC-type nitrate/sulfonate/bicarbonate transport system substrate-binding protein